MIEVSVFSDVDEKMGLFKETVEVASGLIMEEMGKKIRLDIARATPILTGRASASWNAALNTPDLTTKSEDYDNPEGAPYEGWVGLTGTKSKDVIYITNNVSYIDELNSGSSRKAPAGFVEKVTLAAVQQENLLKIVNAVKQRLASKGLGG